MVKKTTTDSWGSQLGVILAVSGSAVGLGNFLRFPGQAAQFGGGAFMLAYFISLIILGIPMCWMEWVLGRHGGRYGFSSPAGILTAAWRHPLAKYIGACCVVTLLCMYTYYSYVEAWCLGYSINFFAGNINFESIQDSHTFWATFLGLSEDGSGLRFGWGKIGIFLFIAYVINFTLVYRGVSKGIEPYVKFAIPTLLLLAFVVLFRVLTLGAPDAAQPENSVSNGLGFMWNPTKTYLYEKAPSGWKESKELIGSKAIDEAKTLASSTPEKLQIKKKTIKDQLMRPRLWLAAASQVFFSLSVGFGAVMVYASYMSKKDDLVLSSLSAMSANEFSEVGLGGLITIPAAYAFLGASGIVGQSIFGLGFNVLPMVFTKMPLGNIFGGLFFFLLFIASISGVLCQLQAGIAFFEETLSIGRKRSVILTAFVSMLGCVLVFWFSKDIKAMDTFDFWIGTFMIFTLSTINITIFGWAFGMKKIFKEAHEGAAIKIPGIFRYIIKYICPIFLFSIFLHWVLVEVFGLGTEGLNDHIVDLIGSADTPPNKVAILVVGCIALLCFFMGLIVSRVKKYKDFHKVK